MLRIDGGDLRADGCTSIIVGPGGAADGGTMTTHTDDCMECDFRISKVPAADHKEGATRKVYRYRSQYPRYLGYDRGETYYPENTDMSIHDWKVGEGDFAPVGEIPQVARTHAYVDGGYGIMNEFQVSIGESTCGSVLTTTAGYKGGHALLEAGELSRIALERCKTAKCAVETMGALAEEYGYYGADETEGEGGESLQVVDPNNAWGFHIVRCSCPSCLPLDHGLECLRLAFHLTCTTTERTAAVCLSVRPSVRLSVSLRSNPRSRTTRASRRCGRRSACRRGTSRLWRTSS